MGRMIDKERDRVSAMKKNPKVNEIVGIGFATSGLALVLLP